MLKVGIGFDLSLIVNSSQCTNIGRVECNTPLKMNYMFHRGYAIAFGIDGRFNSYPT